MPKAIEYVIGTVFNDLTFLKEVKTSSRKRQGLFLCKCGNKKIQDMNNVRLGFTKACGCKQISSRRKHGHTVNTNGGESSLYKRWNAMKYRCNNPNSTDYHRYGGRGITICQEWDDFAVFLQWAKDSGFVQHLTLDRKDNNKGYSPDNCRWVSQYIQSANRSKTKNLKSKYIGVKQLASGNWQAVLNHKNRRVSVGTYKTEQKALQKRNIYIKQYKLPHTIQNY